MAEIIDLKKTSGICLEEARELLDAEYQAGEKDSCLHVAPIVKRLGENKQWFADYLRRRLIHLFKGENSAGAIQPTSQVFQIAGSEKGYYLRANVWMPSNAGHSSNIRKKVFVEEVYHDHTFDLLTLSLHGPGYETELYQYDNSKVTGVVGEEVELQRQGRVKFSEGRMIFMRANVDVHAQFPPSDVSISLNIIPMNTKSISRQQYRFDVFSDDCARISHVDHTGTVFSQLALIDMAESMGDEDTGEVLLDIAKGHSSIGARAAALKVLHKKYAFTPEELINLAAGDALLTSSIEQYISRSPLAEQRA